MKIKQFTSLATIILAAFHFSGAQTQYGDLILIDANTDTEIRTFNGDITHYLSEADSLNLIVEPYATYTQVRFTSSDSYTRTEGGAPYAYYGDIDGDYGFNPVNSIYYGWGPAVGTLGFTVEYLLNGIVQATDTFTITFELAPPPGSSPWSQNGPNIHYSSGNVGIGTTDPGTYKLAVNGNIHTKEVRVDMQNWPDYVFTDGYELPTLEEVENHINDKGHLINIPTAGEVETNGIELGEMNRLLLEKIEELTLYTLQQQQQIDSLRASLEKIDEGKKHRRTTIKQ